MIMCIYFYSCISLSTLKIKYLNKIIIIIIIIYGFNGVLEFTYLNLEIDVHMG